MVNCSTKCEGLYTRINTKKPDEKSVLDYIIVTKQLYEDVLTMKIFEKGEHKVKGQIPSDHNTILLKLNVPLKLAKPTKTKIWKTKGDKWPMYRSALEIQMSNKLQEFKSANSIQMKYELFVETVLDIAKQTIGEKSVPTEYTNSILKAARSDRKLSKAKYENALKTKGRLNAEIEFQEYLQKQLKVKEIVENQVRDKIENTFNQLTLDSGINENTLWKLRKSLNRNKQECLFAVKNTTGNRIYDEINTKKVVTSCYEKLYTQHEPEPDVIQWINHVNNQIETFSHCTEYDDHQINNPIRIEEVITAINSTKNQKAPGPDNIINEFIKYSGPISQEIIHQLFQEIFMSEKIPEQWKQTTIINLYKGKGDSELLTNYRGIILSSNLRKIFERILNNRIKSVLQYTEMQAGGRENFGSCDQIFILNTLINQAVFDKKKLYIAFLDISKAYDKTWGNAAFYSLWKNGVKGKIWRLMKLLNQENSARIKTKFRLTDPVYLHGNLGQGSVLSVCQFSNMIDQLAKNLESSNLGAQYGKLIIPALLLMDDIAVFENSQTRFIQALQVIEQ